MKNKFISLRWYRDLDVIFIMFEVFVLLMNFYNKLGSFSEKSASHENSNSFSKRSESMQNFANESLGEILIRFTRTNQIRGIFFKDVNPPSSYKNILNQRSSY